MPCCVSLQPLLSSHAVLVDSPLSSWQLLTSRPASLFFSAWELPWVLCDFAQVKAEKPRNAGIIPLVEAHNQRRKVPTFFIGEILRCLLCNPWGAPRETEPPHPHPLFHSRCDQWCAFVDLPPLPLLLSFPYLCFLGSAPNLGGTHTKTVDLQHYHHHHQFWFSLSQGQALVVASWLVFPSSLLYYNQSYLSLNVELCLTCLKTLMLPSCPQVETELSPAIKNFNKFLRAYLTSLTSC